MLIGDENDIVIAYGSALVTLAGDAIVMKGEFYSPTTETSYIVTLSGTIPSTGVNNLYCPSPALRGVYDIMGRRVAEPTTSGLYIINGKIVFVVKD
jgi:hypothetical protein